MAESSIVTTGLIGTLSAAVSRQLGRKVVVSHSRYMFKPPGSTKAKWSPWRYTILVEGVTIPFSDLTVNEAKGRLAMLSDLYYAGVFDDCNAKSAAQSRGSGQGAAAQGPGEPAQTAAGSSRPGAAGGGVGGGQSSGSDDRY